MLRSHFAIISNRELAEDFFKSADNGNHRSVNSKHCWKKHAPELGMEENVFP